MPDAILALNSGSSSIKFALFELGDADSLRPLLNGEVDNLGTDPCLTVRNAAGKTVEEKRWPGGDFDTVLGAVLDRIEALLGADRLIAAGHRVVHGGREFTAPVRLTGPIVAALDRLTPLAPLHQPHSLAPIRTLMTLRPALAQVACFDTAFHHTMPPVAQRFALPRTFEAAGVRRYGFHGLSYEYIARTLRETLPKLAAGRVIVAHLGSGASLCAMQDCRSVDTTMGFTALDGLVMGTRCGTLDPGVVLHMLQEMNMAPAAVEDLLYNKSGLLGLSGTSSDMRLLLASDEQHAKEAVELFVFRIASETAALAASLGGLDGFVFTAGIGEHSPQIRTMVCDRLRFLGVAPDGAGTVEVHVIPTDEEMMIARHTLECLAGS